MSEVHRYKVVKMLSEDGNRISYDPHGPEVVVASAFDEATRLFLDAAERCVASERREKELQALLTAADELNDVMRGLMQEFCDRVDRGEVRSKKTYAKFKAALKPAEGRGDET